MAREPSLQRVDLPNLGCCVHVRPLTDADRNTLETQLAIWAVESFGLTTAPIPHMDNLWRVKTYSPIYPLLLHTIVALAACDGQGYPLFPCRYLPGFGNLYPDLSELGFGDMSRIAGVALGMSRWGPCRKSEEGYNVVPSLWFVDQYVEKFTGRYGRDGINILLAGLPGVPDTVRVPAIERFLENRNPIHRSRWYSKRSAEDAMGEIQTALFQLCESEPWKSMSQKEIVAEFAKPSLLIAANKVRGEFTILADRGKVFCRALAILSRETADNILGKVPYGEEDKSSKIVSGWITGYGEGVIEDSSGPRRVESLAERFLGSEEEKAHGRNEQEDPGFTAEDYLRRIQDAKDAIAYIWTREELKKGSYTDESGREVPIDGFALNYHRMSPREREIFEQEIRGIPRKEIAKKFGIKPDSVHGATKRFRDDWVDGLPQTANLRYWANRAAEAFDQAGSPKGVRIESTDEERAKKTSRHANPVVLVSGYTVERLAFGIDIRRLFAECDKSQYLWRYASGAVRWNRIPRKHRDQLRQDIRRFYGMLADPERSSYLEQGNI